MRRFHVPIHTNDQRSLTFDGKTIGVRMPTARSTMFTTDRPSSL